MFKKQGDEIMILPYNPKLSTETVLCEDDLPALLRETANWLEENKPDTPHVIVAPDFSEEGYAWYVHVIVPIKFHLPK